MDNEVKEFLAALQKKLVSIDYIKTEDIPNIGLYMDQVTTFMDEQLEACKRYEDDKILTKTMINNYAKNNLLPPPVKKKYSKEHVLVMIFIYYFKNILSIKDIETLLAPITDKAFDEEDPLDMTAVYEEICQMEKSRIEGLQKDVARSYQLALESFPDVPEDQQDYLRLFAFICNLSFDVYVKKLIIEKLLDELPSSENDAKKKK